jgi:Phage protein Gp138 N-terminal domain
MSEHDDELALEDVMEQFREGLQNELHTALPARVLSYDASTQTCSVRPMVRRALPTVGGNLVQEALPDVHGVPVCWMRAGGFFAHMPLTQGDFVMLICGERDFARWRQTGDVGDSTDVRNHSLSHAMAIPGVYPRTKQLSGMPTDAMVVGKEGGSTIAIKSGGEIDLGAAPSGYVALANLVKARLDTLQSAHDTHKHAFAGTGTVGVVDVVVGSLGDVAATKVKAE